MRGVRFGLIFIVGLFMLINSASAITEIANYADVYLNYTGEMYGFKYLWTQNYSGTYDEFGGIVIENDIGYTVAKNGTGNITAFNATTGALIWTTYIGESDGTPLLDTMGDYIYINPGYSGPISAVYKLNKTTGAILINNSICTLNMDSLTQNDYLIFQNCQNGTVYAYNKDNLAVNWSYTNPNFLSLTMTPLYYQDSLLIGGSVGPDGDLTNDTMNNTVSLNATTGVVRWSSNLTYVRFWDTQPSAENGVVYIAGDAGFETTGFLYAFNNTNGVPLWNFTVGTFSQIALWEDRIVIVNKGTSSINATVFVANKTNGSKICNVSFGGRIYQGLSVVNNIGFFGQAQYNKGFYGINLTNCNVMYKNIMVAWVFNPPAIAKGKLYVKDDSTRLYAFDLGEGTGDWKYLGYNSTGRSSCTDCVTELKYVRTNCSGTATEYNCTLMNTYDSAVFANVINSTYSNYTLRMTSQETAHIGYNSSGFRIFSSGFAGGDGSLGNPYQIASWGNLNNTRNNLNASYILTVNLSSSDSDYSGIGDNWQPVGATTGVRFEGNFNGSRHTISDLIVNKPATLGLGLFGYLGVAGNVSDIGLINISINGTFERVGGLVGSCYGTINNSYTTGTITGGALYTGGLTGITHGYIYNSYSTANVTSTSNNTGGVTGSLQLTSKVYNSYATGNIVGVKSVGGLVGFQTGTPSINNSYATGNVTGTGYAAGGLIGSAFSGTINNSYATGTVNNTGLSTGGFIGVSNTGSISNSYATGNVIGTGNVSGFIGELFAAGTINNSYATGNVTGNTNVGGFAGVQYNGAIYNSYSIGNIVGSINTSGFLGARYAGTISNSFWDVNLSGQASSLGATGKTTDEMKNWTMYTSAGWDTVLWQRIGEKEYPALVLQGITSFTKFDDPTINLFAIESSIATSRDFVFNVSDYSDIANCTLYSGSYNASNSSVINKSSNNTINYSSLSVGSYSAYVNCSDYYGFIGKSNVVSFEVFETVSPVINLFPLSNNTNTTKEIIFNISDDSSIVNCSVYLDGVFNSTNNSVINKSTNNSIVINGVSEGTHNSFVSCIDVYENTGNSSNVSFILDLTNPSLFILSPLNITYNTSAIEFNFLISDSYLDSCWYNYNGVNVSMNCSQNLTLNIARDSHVNLFAYSNDSFGNLVSENVSFYVSSEPVVEVVSFSTSGGGIASFSISDSSFVNGITRNLGKGSSLKFNVNNQTHNLTVNNVSNSSINITVQSFPQVFIMKVGDILNVDVNNDSIKDLEVSYLKYYTNLVSLKIKSIYLPYEVAVVKNETKNESPYEIGNVVPETPQETTSRLLTALGIVVILVVLIALFFVIRHFSLSRKENKFIRRIHYTNRFN